LWGRSFGRPFFYAIKKPKRSKWVRLGFHTTIRQEQEKRLYFL